LLPFLVKLAGTEDLRDYGEVYDECFPSSIGKIPSIL